MYQDKDQISPLLPPPPPLHPPPAPLRATTPIPTTPKTLPFPPRSPMSASISPDSASNPLVHSILGKKANRSSSLSQVTNYFDSSPSEHSTTLFDSPFRSVSDTTPRQLSSFYNPRNVSSDESSSDSSDLEIDDPSPDVSEPESVRRMRPRSRSTATAKGAPLPRRWPQDRVRGSLSSGSSPGVGTGTNSTTSLAMDVGGSSDINGNRGATIREGGSDVGSEDIPLQKLNVRNDSFDARTFSPFVSSLVSDT
jgi:hypothetical protein